VVTGERKMMKLLSKHSSQNFLFYSLNSNIIYIVPMEILFLLIADYIFFLLIYIRATEEVVNETEKNLGDEKPAVEEVADGNKDSPANETEEKEPEDKVNANPILCFYLPYHKQLLPFPHFVLDN